MIPDESNNGTALAAAPNPPFQTCLFQSHSVSPSHRIIPSCETLLKEHFPVSFRKGNFDEYIDVVNHGTLPDFLETEFSLARLDDIYPKLWRVGFPRPPRSLSTQIQMGRTVVVTNALDMHLVWGGGKMFLKPLPRYLLEPEFWTAILCSSPSDLSKIRKSALGLLYTYACLITHPVDLKLALDLGLVPKGVGNEPDWRTWRELAAELLHPRNFSQVHRRFERGELRLYRLNWIYILRDMPSFQLYYSPWYNYTDFLVAHLSWITAATIYIAIVLTAMQVGLSTNALKDNAAFHSAAYGFTVFAILGPIIAVSLVLMMLSVFIVLNGITARSARRQPEPNSETITSSSVEG
ncbi:hypothetical protein F5Y14DRAFT_439034 [Nemania sp. NC0429]|nr:hypothetical protein F5Y14DRAFT_439034 [Nemania sp. NC0429]